jgi:hypothetical protein
MMVAVRCCAALCVAWRCACPRLRTGSAAVRECGRKGVALECHRFRSRARQNGPRSKCMHAVVLDGTLTLLRVGKYRVRSECEIFRTLRYVRGNVADYKDSLSAALGSSSIVKTSLYGQARLSEERDGQGADRQLLTPASACQQQQQQQRRIDDGFGRERTDADAHTSSNAAAPRT